MSAPRTAWDSLIDVVTAYVSDRPVLGGRDSDRAVILAQIERTRAAVSALPAAHAPPDTPSPEATCAFEEAYIKAMGFAPGTQMHHLAVRDGLEAAYAVDCGSRPALAGSPDLAAAFELYGEHLIDCERPKPSADEGCTCGFIPTLERVRGARGAAPEQKQWRWCRCQGIDPIAHVHYAESPNRCARCTSCTGFVGWPRAGYDTLPVGGAAGSPE